MHSSDAEPPCLYQQSRSVVALLLVKCIHPACVWKYVGGSDIFEVCSNWRISLEFPKVFASRGRQRLSFFSALGGEKNITKYREKKGQSGESQKMSQFLVLYLLHAMWGVAEEIRSCQGLNTATCSSPCWIIPRCRQAVLNTTLSAPPYQSLSSTQKLEELQHPGPRKKNLGQSSFWHG